MSIGQIWFVDIEQLSKKDIPMTLWLCKMSLDLILVGHGFKSHPLLLIFFEFSCDDFLQKKTESQIFYTFGQNTV